MILSKNNGQAQQILKGAFSIQLSKCAHAVSKDPGREAEMIRNLVLCPWLTEILMRECSLSIKS